MNHVRIYMIIQTIQIVTVYMKDLSKKVTLFSGSWLSMASIDLEPF